MGKANLPMIPLTIMTRCSGTAPPLGWAAKTSSPPLSISTLISRRLGSLKQPPPPIIRFSNSIRVGFTHRLRSEDRNPRLLLQQRASQERFFRVGLAAWTVVAEWRGEMAAIMCFRERERERDWGMKKRRVKYEQ